MCNCNSDVEVLPYSLVAGEDGTYRINEETGEVVEIRSDSIKKVDGSGYDHYSYFKRVMSEYEANVFKAQRERDIKAKADADAKKAAAEKEAAAAKAAPIQTGVLSHKWIVTW